MIITNPKKDLELLKGLYELRIEMLKLQEELRSDPPSNPQIERNLRILGVLYPIWAGCVFTSGKKPHISRMPCMPLGHVMLSPATRRIRLLPGRKSHKKCRRLLSPGKRAARPRQRGAPRRRLWRMSLRRGGGERQRERYAL